MIVFEEIARDVLHTLTIHGYSPKSFSIVITLLKQDFDKIHAADVDFISEFQLRAHRKLGDIWWDCYLFYSLGTMPYIRMPTAKDEQLKAILVDLAAIFKFIGVSVLAYQVSWVLETTNFSDKFTDHPNLVTEDGLQASEPIEGMYCSIQVSPTISLYT